MTNHQANQQEQSPGQPTGPITRPTNRTNHQANQQDQSPGQPTGPITRPTNRSNRTFRVTTAELQTFVTNMKDVHKTTRQDKQYASHHHHGTTNAGHGELCKTRRPPDRTSHVFIVVGGAVITIRVVRP